MKYTSVVKAALACAFGIIVGSASAGIVTNNVPVYGATFESSAAVAGNDYFEYAENAAVTTYKDNVNVPPDYGWFAGSDDASKIIAGGPSGQGQCLELSTGESVLTNLLPAAVKTAVNGAIARPSGGDGLFETNTLAACISTDVKFVPSDTLSPGYEGGTDASKFALYAYFDSDNNKTNIVLYNAYVVDDAIR